MVTLRETRDSSDIKRASVLIQKHFSSGRGFEAKDLFVATWDDVGFFDQGTDKVIDIIIFLSDETDNVFDSRVTLFK